ncbi:hypothetical protein F0562_005256 [Nyssa sinensis]|uniref:TCP domain-containing protein n=1 Tax=Nyssa sinensis TaxID=561372 RepID=A0A5J5AM19_9ASTE|nr:hypothetical protein F0562_005256 [Nyssa sinensis]
MTFSFTTTTICLWVMTCYSLMLRPWRLLLACMAAINELNKEDHYDLVNSLPKKKPVKKDRHSKIRTARGPRERSVRLSIGIARKFFDLQDMLGFDTPSKTIDWFLIKSKTAIDHELKQTKHKCSGGSNSKSLSSASEWIVSETNQTANNENPQGIVPEWKPLNNFEQPHIAALHHLTGESSPEARARAWGGTREKMRTAKGNDSKRLPDSFSSHSQIKISSVNQEPRNDMIEEYTVSIRLKQSLVFDYQQDNTVNSPNIPRHWDISSLPAFEFPCNYNHDESIGRISNLW